MPGPGNDMSFVVIAGDMEEILHVDACYKYLGKHLCLRVDRRMELEVKHRIHKAWGAFHKHRKVILNQQISLELQLKLFDTCVSLCILFAIVILPLNQIQI